MFQDLISFEVNESFASIANPQGMGMNDAPSSSVGFWHPCQMVVQSYPSLSFFFSRAKYTDRVLLLGVYGAYGHHEYLPDLIMMDTNTAS